MPVSSSHLNLAQLATLREFRRLGTLAAAAESLGYTPGAVSQQVAALERAAGAALVEKSGRQLVLTGAGQVMARYADSILDAERDALRSVRSLNNEVAGPLTIGTWGSTAATLLAPVVAQMAADYPEVEVRSREVDLDAASAAVGRGDVDLAFGLDYPDAPLPRHGAITIDPLHEEEFQIAIAATGSGRDEWTWADLDGLRDLPWILPPAASNYGTAIRAGLRNRGIEPQVRHEVTDTAASLQLAASGLGATVATPLMRRISAGLPLSTLRLRKPFTRRVVLLSPSGQLRGPVAALSATITRAVSDLLGPEARSGSHPATP